MMNKQCTDGVIKNYMLFRDSTDVNVNKEQIHTHRYSINVCTKVCKHAWAFIHMSMCWYVLLSLCLCYQTAKPEQARWTAERIIYGLVIGISLLSCSILIADASLRGCVWESSTDRIIMSQSNVKYKSIKIIRMIISVGDTDMEQQRPQKRKKSLLAG